jgi:hypothetical protein
MNHGSSIKGSDDKSSGTEFFCFLLIDKARAKDKIAI